MEEESSTGTAADPAKTPSKKQAKGAARSAAAAPRKDDEIPGGWRTWGIVGLVLVGGVVAWKLAGSTYKSDVETICNAERGSGYTLDKDQSKVTQWVREHLSTPEGNEFFSTLSDTRPSERAKKLQAEADAQHVRSCAMVPSIEQLAAQADYRSDLQHLCSSLTFPKLPEMDDATRVATLVDYIDKQAKSPRTKELEDPLRQAASPADRARLLRDTGAKMDVFSCETAKTLESPQAEPKPAGAAMVRVRTEPQVNGPLSAEDLAKGVVGVTPAMNDCYRKGLERKPNLGGKLAVKMQVDSDGKVMQDLPMDVDREVDDRETVLCIAKALKEMKLPKNPGPLVTALLPLELTTAGVAAAAPGTASSSKAAGPGAPVPSAAPPAASMPRKAP